MLGGVQRYEFGRLRATGRHVPKSNTQPNKSEGVKVGSTRVQSGNLPTISPHGQWMVAHKVLAGRVAADKANVPVR